MNKLILLVFFALPIFALAQTTEAETEGPTINWMGIEEALEAQKENPKKIMIDVYTSWCNPCKMLDKVTFHNEDVVEFVNENFNAESPDPVTYKGREFTNPDYNPEVTRGRNGVHQLSRKLGVNAYPTIAYLNEDGDLITAVSGFLKPQQIEIYLKLFANDDFLTIDTKEKWEEYQASFVPEFVE